MRLKGWVSCAQCQEVTLQIHPTDIPAANVLKQMTSFRRSSKLRLEPVTHSEQGDSKSRKNKVHPIILFVKHYFD